MKETFRSAKLSSSNMAKLARINAIIREYQAAGYVLTLRQLYYQLVSRDVIPNQVAEYAKLSKLLGEGRMAGIVDWEAIEDRLRLPYTPASWSSPEEIMDTVINQYKQPRMEGQKNYIEVWVEKDALSGVLKRVTSKYHVPIMVNRGYSSITAIHDSYHRFRDALQRGQVVHILYLGDFDPSGLDMIRDVYDRPLEMLVEKAYEFLNDVYDEELANNEFLADELEDEYRDYEDYPLVYNVEKDEGSINYSFDPVKAFLLSRFKVTPIALTKDQITKYKPPPNPAKKTDPRSRKFMDEHGGSSWEVDALRPEVLNSLLTEEILDRIDIDKYNDILDEEKIGRAKLRIAKNKLSEIDVDPEADDESEEELDED